MSRRAYSWVLGAYFLHVSLLVNSLAVPERSDATAVPSSQMSLSLPKEPAKLRYRCRVAYDGAEFSGFQLQAGRDNRTVQGVLEEVLSKRFDRPVRVVGAGRTDAGVHARGQAVHFDLSWDDNQGLAHDENWNAQLQAAMNRMLPTDLRVWNVGPAPPPCPEEVNSIAKVYPWNVMRKSNSKLYSYRLCLANAMDPIERHCRWHLDWGHEIDPVYLKELFKRYEGKHDFGCFAGALEATARRTGFVMSTIRTIHSCKLIEEDAERQLYRVDIYLDGALYKMVRNVVGTALDVCRGKLDEATFTQFLEQPSKHNMTRDDNPCKPAPPQGLTLERVFYSNDQF